MFMSLRTELLTDEEMVAASRKGNEDAFRQLFDKYWHDLYKIANRRVSSTEDVKDILQDVFLSLWNNIMDVEVSDSLGGYLYIALRNRILNYYDKETLRYKLLASQQFMPVEAENLAWHSLRTKEIRQFVMGLLEEMPPQMKQVFLLSREEQLTNAEIAALLGLAPQTVKNQLYRALQLIREELKTSHLRLTMLLLLAAIFSKK